MRNLFPIAAFMVGGFMQLCLQPMQPVSAQASISQPVNIPAIKPYQPKATAANRLTYQQDQLQNLVPENFDVNRYPISDRNAERWQNILWTVTVLSPQTDFVAQALDNILALTANPKLTDKQKSVVDSAMQVGTQLYLSNPGFYANVGRHFVQTIEYSSDSQWVAMSLSALAKSRIPPSNLKQLGLRVQQRFPNWRQDVFLYTTLQNLSSSQTAKAIPPLTDLLAWQIAPGQPQMYVLCQPNREILCLAVAKDGNGRFMEQNGQLWSVPLLLQSIHRLEWNFYRGQTPQGIYRIEGLEPQPDDEVFRAYGQFPLVKLFLPYEDGAQEFLPNRKGKFTGNLQTYQTLLPPTWRNYFPIQQSYWAGKIGRSLFRIHGTGEAIDFFRVKTNPTIDSYYWNPTLGCLSALELYDRNGQLQQADVPKVLNILSLLGKGKIAGYLIVVEVPSRTGGQISPMEVREAIARSK
ncbi:hypothetical protein V2H45_05445 [Tumidithrix elongata RA019]|uniref:Uncharacterized protein n=1 Tax=Tumidithrix elongata BACA0141 TaxID=2716417 RepID=A0AAW9Q097_9CYAN|nr:hypothetical protein [Tumidithrix elongata RA019]